MDLKCLSVLQNAYLALLRLPVSKQIENKMELCELRNLISEITGDSIEKTQNNFEFIILDEKGL